MLRKRREIIQRQQLSFLARLASGEPTPGLVWLQNEVLPRARAKYLDKVIGRLKLFFPKFYKCASLDEEKVQRIFHGRRAHLDNTLAIDEMFSLLRRHVSRAGNSECWLDLLLLERAIATASYSEKFKHNEKKILERASAMNLGRKRFLDYEGVSYVSLKTDLAFTYPKIHLKRAKTLQGGPMIAAVFQKGRDGAVVRFC